MRLSIDRQVERRALVCPQTKEELVRVGDSLRGASYSYPVIRGVSLLVADQGWAEQYAASSNQMTRDYTATRTLAAFTGWLLRDYRTTRSQRALASVCDVPPDSLGLSIGGGPGRAHAQLVNLNIGIQKPNGFRPVSFGHA